MSITPIKTIGERKEFQVSKDNVNYHNLAPNNLELSLVDHKNGHFSIDMTLSFNERLCLGVRRRAQGSMGLKETSEEDALKKYHSVLEQIKRGGYELDVYSDGRVHMKLKK